MYGTTLAATTQPVPVVGLIAYVFAAVGAVVTGTVVLAGTTLTGYSTRSVAAGVGGLLGAGAVAAVVWLVANDGLSTALGVAGVLGLAVALLWGVPLAVGRAAVARVTNAANPLGYAVLGWPLAVAGPLAYLRTVQPPSGSPVVTAVLFGGPVVGTAVVGVLARRLYARLAG